MERLFPKKLKLPSWGLAFGTLSLASLAAIATISFTDRRDDALLPNGGVQDRSILGMLADRSPGARLIGALVMAKQKPQGLTSPQGGKPVGAPPAAEEPTAQRVIPRRPEEEVPGIADADLIPAVPGEQMVLIEPGPPGSFGTSPELVPGGPGTPLPPITGIGGPGPTPPDVIVPPTTEPTPPTVPPGPPEVPGAVPEPETWALMVLGMLGCGAAMRRQRRKAQFAPAI